MTMLLPTILLAILSASAATPELLDQIPAIEDFEDPEFIAKPPHPDASLTTLQLVNKYGYNGELHQVVTNDGYILEMHRLRGRSNSTRNKPAVLVMPGILASSAVWVLSGTEKSLGFILSDAGYDVWLGNARGSNYSLKHVSASITKKQYWNFSWHEIGTRDLPAKIDYILANTGQKKLFYLAHSQGSTAFFVMSTQLPRYQRKVHAMFGMAPVAYVSRMYSPIFKFLARNIIPIELLIKMIGAYEFKPTSEAMKKFKSIACAEDAITQPLCANVLFLIAGYDIDQYNKTLLPIILGHVPAGASTKQALHYMQLINNGLFRQYDYGAWRNMRVYGKPWPPSYDLKKIRVPVSLHYGSNDWLANVKDVDQLYRELGNPIGKFRVPHNKFNHLDFMWAKDVKELLYDKMLSLMSRYRE